MPQPNGKPGIDKNQKPKMPSILSSPDAFNRRNAVEVHTLMIDGWKAHHRNVQLKAEKVLELHLAEQERRHAEIAAEAEEKLLAEETAKALAEQRKIEAANARNAIPVPPPRIPTPPRPSPPAPRASTPTPAPTPPTQLVPSIVPPPVAQLQPAAQLRPSAPQFTPVQPPQSFANPPQHAVQVQSAGSAPQSHQTANPFSSQKQQAPNPFSAQSQVQNPFSKQPQQTAPELVTPSTLSQPAALSVEVKRPEKVASDVNVLLEIHKRLKRLRQGVADGDKAFRVKAGDMRRTIVRTMGQLMEDGGNKQQMNTIVGLLTEAFSVPSAQVDPRLFMRANPSPVEGASHNSDTMPLMFIYLLNIFAKALIRQLISEASAKSTAAEPIAILAHQIFSDVRFQWRNESFIDIMMAKYRVVCPVLFGIVGNEKTEQGRALLGWKKDGNNWVSIQEHNDRMAGLGVGYASLALRRYAKTTRRNPFPPHHYWTAMAAIINTPHDLICSTQYVVLKSMLENYGEKFVGFYGDMARAALRVALFHLPLQAPEGDSNAGALKLLGEKWVLADGFHID